MKCLRNRIFLHWFTANCLFQGQSLRLMRHRQSGLPFSVFLLALFQHQDAFRSHVEQQIDDAQVGQEA